MYFGKKGIRNWEQNRMPKSGKILLQQQNSTARTKSHDMKNPKKEMETEQIYTFLDTKIFLEHRFLFCTNKGKML